MKPETKHSDPQHPVFGLGGCAMLVADYTTLIRPRWLQMKQRFFGGPDVPLHANELRLPSQAQIDALCEVFAIDRFTRVVAVASSKTAFPDGYPPYQLIALTLMKHIERAGSRFPLSRLALIVESSSRADALANRFLGPFNVIRIENANGTAEAQIHHYFLPKALNEPGLEIADFIMHTVGARKHVLAYLIQRHRLAKILRRSFIRYRRQQWSTCQLTRLKPAPHNLLLHRTCGHANARR